MSWVEWSVSEVGDIFDRHRVAETNPALGIRLQMSVIDDELGQMTPEGYARERLGWWSDFSAQPPTIDYAEWSKLRTDTAPPGRPSYGVKFALDGSRVSLAVAVPDGENVHVEAVAQMPTADPRIGGLPLAEWLAGSWRECSEIVVDGKDGTGALVAELLRLKVPAKRVRMMSTPDAITAHTQFLAAVQSGHLTHIDQAELNAAVKVATKRKIGTLGGWGWQAIGDGDVLDLEAATLAFAGAKNAKPLVATAPRRIY